MSIRVIYINFNSFAMLWQSLCQLLKHNSQVINVVIVDNATLTNDEENQISKNFEQVKLIKNSQNLGFAKAANIGAVNANEDWLLFLNPDVICEAETVLNLVNFATQNKLDATCFKPESQNYSKPIPTPLSLAYEFSPLNRIKFLGNIISKYPKTLWGGGMLVKTQVFNKLQGFSEDFFLWFEDSDLCYRLLKNRFKIAQSNVYAKHFGGESFAKLAEKNKKIIFFNSLNTYAKKHFGFLGKLVCVTLTLINK